MLTPCNGYREWALYKELQDKDYDKLTDEERNFVIAMYQIEKSMAGLD